ncbi:hypothetical protein Taro_003310 [Colocasia esculenta]|uniref:Uncharacterized protein n=1 Tax=Colocasia esculenta TaxID=4460 RepID=A0A843TNG3_COLES|nr:hypothetical protein [Colocasia esculenta]
MALTREQAEALNLVIGILPILGRAACVLVDPGASLCFASEEFYESLVVKVKLNDGTCASSMEYT